MSTQQLSPQPSQTPIAYAPPAASQPSWNSSAPPAVAMPSPATSPMPGQPVAAPTPGSWDSAQVQANPAQWQQAFNQLVGAQTPQQAYQGWAAPSVSTPSGLTQGQVANWVQAPQVGSAAPTYSPQPTQGSPLGGLSVADVQYLAAQAANQTLQQQYQAAGQQAAAQQAAMEQAAAPQRGDAYLDNVSNESLEVLSHFGPEAPFKLNTYSCQVEDALLEALSHQQNQASAIQQQHEYITQVQDVLAAATADREAMLAILTDPARLADYTTEFFGPNGPYPTETPAEQAQRALAEGMIQQDGPLMPAAGNPRMDVTAQEQVPQQGQPFQRPQMSMPQPGSAPRMAGNGNVWSQFSQVMDVAPQDAWKVLAQADPESIRTKLLFMEG